MIQIPIPLNGERQSRLNSLLLRGNPNLFVTSDRVNGQEVYVLVAAGEAADWIKGLVSGKQADHVDPVDPLEEIWGPEVLKPIPVTDGPSSAKPGDRRPS
jgi:hypothetical protein